MKIQSVVAAALCAIALVGCHSSGDQASATASASQQSDSLSGVYGYLNTKTGKVDPLLKVDASGAANGVYVLYEFHNGQWVRPKAVMIDAAKDEAVKPFAKADLEKVLRHSVSVDVDGVQTRSLALVHVPAGWTDNTGTRPFETKSGYFALSMIGPIELVRM